VLLKELAQPGVSIREVGERYGVSRQAVSNALGREGVQLGRGRAYSLKSVIPWRVRVAHEDDYHLRYLRLYGRKVNGLPLTAAQDRRLKAWCAAREEEETVVCYDPESGFSLDVRQAGDERYWRP
jgi:hypothetical protein